MPLMALSACDLLICPRCAGPVRIEEVGGRCLTRSCWYADNPFPVVGGTPALIDFDESVVLAADLVETAGASLVDRAPKRPLRQWIGRLMHPANRQAPRNVDRMLEIFQAERRFKERPGVLVVGGGEVGAGLADLYRDDGIDLIAFDIYWSPSTQFIADGHQIPLANCSVDAVIIQAVLEHVIEPPAVVAEIHRVLRERGLVYADTPFLQQVHEGPFDFTRFTESGHRYLFRDFECIDSGVVAGAATALAWSIDYFVRSLFRSHTAGLLARLVFCWLPLLDRLLDPRFSLDAASSVYFLGRKSPSRLSAHAVIGCYHGAQ